MKRTLKTTIAALSLLLITSLLSVNEVRAEEVKKEQNKKESETQNQKITYSKDEEEAVLKKIDDLNKNPSLEYGKYLTRREMLIRLEMMKKKKEYNMGWYERMIKNSELYKKYKESSEDSEFSSNVTPCDFKDRVSEICATQKLLSKISQDQVTSILINFDGISDDLYVMSMMGNFILSVIIYGSGDYIDYGHYKYYPNEFYDLKIDNFYELDKLTGKELDDMIKYKVILNSLRKINMEGNGNFAKSIVKKLNDFFNN